MSDKYLHTKNLKRVLILLNLLNESENPLDRIDDILDAECFMKRLISDFKKDVRRAEQNELLNKFGVI